MGSKSKREEKNKLSFSKIIFISLAGTVLFFAILALFSLISLKNGINQNSYMPVGLVSGAISALLTGFAAVRPIRAKGAVYGAITGIVQALLCSIVLFVSNDATAGTGIFILSAIIILFSSIGGISAVNLKFKKKY